MDSIRHSAFKGHIGIAREDITPPLEIYVHNWGAAKSDHAGGIHRPLTLTCLTFQSAKNKKPLVLISADLGWWKNSQDESFVRDEILKALSLDASRLMFCLSHTHAGPSLCRDDAAKPGGNCIEPYLRQLQQSAIRATRRALASAKAAVLTWQYGKCDLAKNRDVPESKKKRFVVGFNPEQSSDDTLLVGRITNTKQKIIATIVNYACHPTTLAWENRLISPDYVGAMREVVETSTNAPCVFLQGASGELAPAEQYVGDIRVAEKHGRKLGHAVLSTLEGMSSPEMNLRFHGAVESGAPLAIWKQSYQRVSTNLSAEMVKIPLPLKSLPSLAEIEKSWDMCSDPILKERLWRQRGVRKSIGDGKTTKMPVWLWRLGDSILAGQPTETYSQFQQELRRQLSPNTAAVMNIVNGHIGYLPPKNLFGKNLYAVWQTPFAKGSLEVLTQGVAKVAKKLIRR
jgi:hypothetical protein